MSQNFVEIAKIGATYGLEGELRLYPLANSIETILSYGEWYTKSESAKQWQILKDENVFRRSGKVYIKLAGVDNVNSAKKYVNTLIGVPRDSLPDLDNGEVYWTDLIGMSVENKTGDSFGKIADVMETGYNEVLICRSDKGEFLIPYTNDYILKEDQEAKQMLVDWEYDF